MQNRPNNDKVDSTNSNVERAEGLLANGASPSQTFNENGADNTNKSPGSNAAERVYGDETGDEYDPETGYTTRTAEEIQA